MMNKTYKAILLVAITTVGLLFSVYAAVTITNSGKSYRVSVWQWNNPITWATWSQHSGCYWIDYLDGTRDLFIPLNTIAERESFYEAAMEDASGQPEIGIDAIYPWEWECGSSKFVCNQGWSINQSTGNCAGLGYREYFRTCSWVCSTKHCETSVTDRDCE